MSTKAEELSVIHLVLVALAVHLVSTVLTMQPITITLPRWAWHALWGAVCVTLECVTLGADRWLQGLAAGGIALLLSRLDDFLVTAADLALLRLKRAAFELRTKPPTP